MQNNTMKNLFFHSLRSKKTLVTIASLLLFFAVVSFVLYEGTKKTVAITVNGEQQEITTHANTVGELLEENNLVVSNDDFLHPQ